MIASLLWLSGAAADPGPPVLHETRISEPVFRGHAQLYGAGPAEAPPVVLVHGLGDQAARDWNGLIPVLARDHRVLAFDLPGFGRSDKDNDPYTPVNYAAFVRHVVEREFGSRPVNLVGHSLGGAIALKYAALHPESVSALVLADVPGILHRSAYSKYLTSLGINFLPSLYPAQNDHLRNLAGNILSLVEKARPTPEAIVLSPRLRKTFLNEDPTKIAGLAVALEDFSADLARVTMPTLLLWGARDEIAPLRNGQTLAAMLPNASLVVFPTSGHTPMEEVPVAFNARVVAFLAAPVVDRPAPLAAEAATRSASCHGRRGAVFEGRYDSLLVAECRDVVIRRAQVRTLRIVESAATIEDSVIGGSDGGLTVDDSRVTITASRVEGPVAIRAVGARLDIAGSRVFGRRAAVEATLESQLLFSLSELASPHTNGRAHGLWRVRPGEPL